MRAPVEKAVDWVIGKAVAGLKKVGGLFTGKGKGKNPDPSKDAAKGTAPGATPADPKAAGTPQPNAASPGADARTPEQKKADLDAGLAEANKFRSYAVARLCPPLRWTKPYRMVLGWLR